MHRVDHTTAVPVIPSPDPVGTPGFFTEGDPLMAVPATRVTDDFLNAVQEELVAPVLGMGLTLDKGSRDQLFEAILKIAAQGTSGNVLLNPDFRIWNRYGTTVVGATFSRGYYGPDRWLFDSAGGTGNLSRSFLTGATPRGPSGSAYACRWDSIAVVGQSAKLRQRVERAETYEGRPITLAFDLRRIGGADHSLLAVEVEQVFGSGSPVTTTLTPVLGNLVDTSWRRFAFTGTLPSVAGKDLLQPAYLEVRVIWPVNTAIDVEFTAFSLSRGSKDPGFFSRPEPLERLMCWRYYENTARENNGMSGTNGAGSILARLWDTAFVWATGGGNAIGSFRDTFRADKFTNTGTFGIRWWGRNNLAGFVTERAAVDVHHAVITSATGLESYNGNSTGAPIFSGAPPAAGTKVFAAGWEAFAEITRTGDDLTAP